MDTIDTIRALCAGSDVPPHVRKAAVQMLWTLGHIAQGAKHARLARENTDDDRENGITAADRRQWEGEAFVRAYDRPDPDFVAAVREP